MDHAAQFRPLKRLFPARLYCNRKTVTVGLPLARALDAFKQAVILDVVMSAKSARGDGRSTKRVKLDATSSNTYHYSDGADIEHRLQAQTQDALLAGEFLFKYHMSGLLTYSVCSTYCTSQPAYSQSWRGIHTAARRAVDSRA